MSIPLDRKRPHQPHHAGFARTITVMPRKPTFNRVAKLARVSPATVTRLAAGNRGVDPAIRQRVEKAAAKLGIDLQKKRDEASRVIAFVLANREVLHSFHSRVLVGAEAYIREQGWEVVFLVYRYAAAVPATELAQPQILTRRMPARGVILAGVNSPNILQALDALDVPYSILGNNFLSETPASAGDTVWSDDVAGANQATRDLLELGHRDIWFIGNSRYPWFARCQQGYASAMDAAGMTARSSDLQADSVELGYLGAKTLFDRGERVTAILAGSDDVAAGVYQAAREAGRRVPADLSVVGFNDSNGAVLHPPLTTIREFPEKLGQHLAEFILQRIREPYRAVQHLTIPTQLVSRSSTGPAPFAPR